MSFLVLLLDLLVLGDNGVGDFACFLLYGTLGLISKGSVSKAYGLDSSSTVKDDFLDVAAFGVLDDVLVAEDAFEKNDLEVF